ncbi:short-chain dehydrogenase [Streptomyces olivaceoviridis]|uniref:SDR family NAD(P)-dependent oxidoreductase n=1 Tax=Streptomyces olivaceoviridis TaxID=1921 RepID=UPI0016789F3C|nr:SDR family oxidoreductase [Streptomyces olivaceoviridis]GGZ02764.1 short-chain dehydrogenase [Streptomyces olivaceoviridis]
MDLHLAGRRAVVTGASRGIGLAVARALAAEGASVALVARSAGRAEEQAALLREETGAEVIAVPADTGDDTSVAEMAREVRERLGGVDILVNNAATTNPGAFPDDALEAEINVKVRGYLRCVRAFAPAMTERGWGRIINVSGLATRQSGSVTGSVRNAAVVAMTKNLADELGPHGVNVVSVQPGATRTRTWLDNLAKQATATGQSPAELEERVAATVSIGRIVEPHEVASVIAFLASPLSVAVNGDTVITSGGVKGPIYY